MSKVNTKTIRILKNMVLIKPDPHYETYHLKGNDTGLIVSNFEYENGKKMSIKERHYSVTGTVYAVPDKIVCNTKKVVDISKKVPFKTINEEVVISDRSLMAQKDNLIKDSLQYGTTVELKVGDRVRYSYTAHQKSVDNNMEAETEEGQMFFIPYDKVFCVVNEDLFPTKMVNGYVAVKSTVNKQIQDVDGVSGLSSDSGLFIVKNNKDIKNRKGMKVSCILSGTPLESYFAMPEYGPDSHDEINPGDELIIDPRGKQRLEPYLHQHIEEDVFLIHRRQIILKNVGNFEDIQLE